MTNVDLDFDRQYTRAELDLLARARRHFEGREVVCPKCRAGIGMPCRGHLGQFRQGGLDPETVGTHAERVALAMSML